MSLSSQILRARATHHSPDQAVDHAQRLAVIALIFWEDEDGLSVCLGRRAINPLDPWSGDMAFPGGRAETIDRNLHDVAARETKEEVGLILPRESLLGRMDKMEATGSSTRPLTTVWPLVYLLESAPEPFRLNEEMSDAMWVPTAHLWNPKNWMAFSFPPTQAQRSGISIGNHFLWGFSLKVLVTLSEQIGKPISDIAQLESVLHSDHLSF
ncbi:MAG: CoA pyrophosphatase [Pseudomonadota bacterium]